MEPVYEEEGVIEEVVAGIDVHKRMLAVVVACPNQTDKQYVRRKFGTTRKELRALAAWLGDHQVRQAAMESTAEYWKPVWMELEPHFRLHLAQARSTTGAKGRKSDFRDAVRIVNRLRAHDLTLSFVPDAEQREWRQFSRACAQMTKQHVRLRNQMECVLEQAQIKLTSVIKDVLGASGRRILKAIVEGVDDPDKLAALGDRRLHASERQLSEALDGRIEPVHRTLLKQQFEQLELLEVHLADIQQRLAKAMQAHQDAVARLCRIPGIHPNAAQQMIAEVGVEAAAFPSAGHLCSWVGVCPGQNESAGVAYGNRSAKGNRSMRRILTQVAWAAVRTKDSYFQGLFHRLVPSLGVKKAIWAVAHRILRLIWKLLHQKVSYIEHGALAQDPKKQARRKQRLVRELRRLGYTVQLTASPAADANSFS